MTKECDGHITCFAGPFVKAHSTYCLKVFDRQIALSIR